MVLKGWVTGDKAVQDEDESQCELDGFMRELMELSGQRNFIGHKSLPTTKDPGSSGAPIRTTAASDTTCTVVRRAKM